MRAAVVRWGRFHAVGGMGFAVQMVSLSVLHRVWPGHDLWATAVALEVTLLHNFLWHARYTWGDREGSRLGQMVRFHAANGVVSLVGNLAVVHWLTREWHWPLLAANAVAVGCCSVVNFVVGGRWVFAEGDFEVG